MRKETAKRRIKREMRRLMRAMDLMKAADSRYADVYQALGTAWEHLGLQCLHWDGFRPVDAGKLACRICGKIKGTGEHWVLVPLLGVARIGQKKFPNSKRTFASKRDALVDSGTIHFHGAALSVEVSNPHKSRLFRKMQIDIAPDRIVRLTEGDVECWIDSHQVRVSIRPRRRKGAKPPYGAFISELPKHIQKRFPVLVEYDDRYDMRGITLFKGPSRAKPRARRS